LSEEEAKIILKSILEGVSYLHENGVVHRDIKPANLLFQKKGDISTMKIADFGLSATYNDSLMRSFCDQVGTMLFMAPELVIKQDYGKVILIVTI